MQGTREEFNTGISKNVSKRVLCRAAAAARRERVFFSSDVSFRGPADLKLQLPSNIFIRWTDKNVANGCTAILLEAIGKGTS